MPNKKISQLNTGSTLDGSELVPIVQGGVTKKVTTQDIADLGAGTTPNLQEVTDEGSTTTNLIEVGGLDNTAKTITLNKGGTSSTGSGIQFEESGSIVGYIRTAVGSAFDFLHPLSAFRARVALNLLTGDRTYNLPDNSGTIALTSDIPSIFVLTSITDGTVVTGSTSNTISYSSPLQAANKIAVGDIFRWFSQCRFTGTAGTKTVRYYVNTSNSLSGATLLGTLTTAAASLSLDFARELGVKSSTVTEVISTTSTNISTAESTNSVALSNVNVDWTQQLYFIIAIQLANSADSGVVSLVKIRK
jgi:hypothetical protein